MIQLLSSYDIRLQNNNAIVNTIDISERNKNVKPYSLYNYPVL